ncbi:hypothetical protein SXCG_00109 [Synechococcus phage S-CAM8]|uniref:Uncharacterized protein n=1 Tax=Synechococcus phage S-CAM8 TaxID=754038 RepID=G8EY92_9CAUD|nr:hypothetical protein SXCG_00109 [Synechococcus phage S-CAM8]AGN34019.1 hypothetical protein SXCG_00109 [Synechococcus phage S-CAM8]
MLLQDKSFLVFGDKYIFRERSLTNPNALYEDMETLNMLYEELCWSHEEELEFKADYENNRIIIQIKKTK